MKGPFEGILIVQVDGEPRVLDVDVGRHMDMARPEDIRRTIEKYAEDLSDFGILARRAKNHGGGRGRPTTEYLLNEDQALFIAGRSDTTRGRETYKALVKLFGAVRRGELVFRKSEIPLFASEPCTHDAMWGDQFVVAMCRLYGQPYTPERFPRWLISPISILYKVVFGAKAYAELKRLNPYENNSTRHHQWLATEARNRLRNHVGSITITALVADSVNDFWERIRSSYGTAPLQLRIPGTGPRKALP